MKRFVTLTAILTALTGLTIGFAGPARYEEKNVAPMPPPCDFHGFYIGLNAGVAGLTTDITDVDDFVIGSGSTSSVEDTNFAGGGQLGYNWQKGGFVFGLEVDADYLATDEFRPIRDTQPGAGYYGQIDFQGSFRARAGVAIDKALIYATAGLAVSHGDSKFVSEEEGYADYNQEEWQAGFVGGVGVEYMFNCHWSARMEALFYHYSTSSETHDDYQWEFQNQDWSVRAGVNYMFGGP